MLDLIRFLWYTKYVNKLNTGTGVSTEVSLPSGSSEAIHVGSSPVVRTRVRAKFCLSSYFLFLPSPRGTTGQTSSTVFGLRAKNDYQSFS